MSTESSTGIQSAEIALDVLTRLAELGGAVSVSELGRSLDMPRAKAHRYLVSLERRGYVEQDPASARYRLGPQALHTGLAALAEVDFVKVAAGCLEDLSAAIGQTVFLSVWGQHGPTIVQWRDARLPVTSTGSVSAVLTQVEGIAFYLSHDRWLLNSRQTYQELAMSYPAYSFRWNGSKRVTLRAESVNLFNTPQFADPGLEPGRQSVPAARSDPSSGPELISPEGRAAV